MTKVSFTAVDVLNVAKEISAASFVLEGDRPLREYLPEAAGLLYAAELEIEKLSGDCACVEGFFTCAKHA